MIGGGFKSSSMCRIANLRLSRKAENIKRNINGDIIDENFNSVISLNMPIIHDDLTTLLVNFDDNLNINQNFASIIDPINGIYSFDVNIDKSDTCAVVWQKRSNNKKTYAIGMPFSWWIIS